jgi:hypothetical protein
VVSCDTPETSHLGTAYLGLRAHRTASHCSCINTTLVQIRSAQRLLSVVRKRNTVLCEIIYLLMREDALSLNHLEEGIKTRILNKTGVNPRIRLVLLGEHGERVAQNASVRWTDQVRTK